MLARPLTSNEVLLTRLGVGIGFLGAFLCVLGQLGAFAGWHSSVLLGPLAAGVAVLHVGAGVANFAELVSDGRLRGPFAHWRSVLRRVPRGVAVAYWIIVADAVASLLLMFAAAACAWRPVPAEAFFLPLVGYIYWADGAALLALLARQRGAQP